MKRLRNYLAYVPKSLLAVIIGVTSLAVPMSSIAQTPPVRIESTMGVANQTAGDTQYKPSVNAKVDEVVKVQVWYHNMEDDDSGKIANDLKMKIDVPNTPGKNQTITAKVGGSNTNQVTSTAGVNLSLDNAYLEFIPGSARWRHNAGTNDNVNFVTKSISDDVVTKGTGLVLENAKPCFNFEATVTILARVKAAEVSIKKEVRKLGQTSNDWKQENTAKASDKLEYLLTVKNQGNTTLRNVVVGDNLPAHMTYVKGSAMLKNGNNPNGAPLGSDNIVSGGVNIGHYSPGAVAYVWFTVKIDKLEECGKYTFKNVGLVKSDQTKTFENYAITKVNVPCEEKKEFACKALTANPLSGKPPLVVTFNAEAMVSEGVQVEQYIFDFGDGQTATVDQATIEHTYAEVGTYTATVRIKTTAGTTQVVDKCKVKITVADKEVPPTEERPPAEQLPVTGFSSILGGVFGISALGATTKNWISSRRSLKAALLQE